VTHAQDDLVGVGGDRARRGNWHRGSGAAAGPGSRPGPRRCAGTTDGGVAWGPVVARRGPAEPLYKLEDAWLQWPLLPADKAFGAIDGRHLHQLVEDQTAISRRYRHHGHPQFWGRVIGSSADEENQQWMLSRFKQMGLTDVHVQSFDLAPQWMPQSWDITATGPGKTLEIEAAQPAYQTQPTPPGGLDVEAAYVGTGSEAGLHRARRRSEGIQGLWRRDLRGA